MLKNLQRLIAIKENIDYYQKRINEPVPTLFMDVIPFIMKHNRIINKKCLAFWQRKFNRVLLTIKKY